MDPAILHSLWPFAAALAVGAEYSGLAARWWRSVRRFWRHSLSTLQASCQVASRRNRGQKPLGNAGFPAVWRRVP